MMRRLSYCLMLLLVLVSCTREKVFPDEWDGPSIVVNLQLEEAYQTKADDVYEQPGDNVFHENEIKWVDFYFYPDGNTTEQASYHIRKTLDQLTRNTATFRLELTPNQVNYQIFPSASNTTETLVFALANVDKTLLDSQDDLSMTNLKSLLVTTNFEADPGQENHRQQQFMMSGEAYLHLKQPDGRTQKEVAEPLTIALSRYACKLTVSVKTQASVPIKTNRTDDNNNPVYEEWTPCVEEMKVYIADAVKTVSLGGEPRKAASESEVLTYRANPLLFFQNQNTGTDAEPIYEQIFDQSPGGYYNTYPTYMYPQTWENGKEGEPYLKLVLPWLRTKDDANGIKELKKEFYYKILIPQDRRGGEYANTFTRNNWYHYNIDVGMLGADTDEASVLIDPIDCYIYYWQDKNVVVKHADIGNARYLSVNQEQYVLYDEASLPIRFTTSHPVSYQVRSATRPYYGSQTSGPANGGTIYRSGDGTGPADDLYPEGTYYLGYDAGGWFSQNGGIINMYHPLDDNYTSANFDYSPYTIVLTIYHSDKGINSNFSQTVTITQNPAIFITAEENSDPKLEHPDDRETPYPDEAENANYPVYRNYAHNGYVFIDGQRIWRHKTARNDDGEYGTIAKHLAQVSGLTWNKGSRTKGIADRLEWLQWRTVNFTGGNRNRYTIHVSVLPDDSDYIIGDPRTLTPETWNNGLENQSPIVTTSTYYNWYDSDGNGERDAENTEYETQFRPGKHVSEYKTDGAVEHPLQYYYPAEESDRTKNMLAPALMVSSRFGGVEFYDGFTQRSARFKCATYQEDGYPAGRWRLPTKAEIDFIATLTQKSGFVKLFGAGGKYWSANGAVQPNAGIQNVSYALVRCVYDTWYWESYNDRLPAEDRDTYVFGDYPR